MNGRLTLVTIFICTLALTAGAQTAQKKPAAPTTLPAVPAPDMSRQPAVGTIKAYAPPKNEVDQLPNGLRIIAAEDDRFPQVNIRISLRAGNSRLAPAQAGLADAEAALLTAGTPGRTALQLAQYADSLGGEVDAGSGPDFLTISGSALSQNATALVQLMADVVLHPTFPQTEVDLRKANMLQELEANRADPDFLAGVVFDKLLFGPHPYAITAPTEASIAAIDRDALVKFHTDYFLPNNQAVVVVVGQIKTAHAQELVHQFFGEWKLGKPQPPPSPDVVPATLPRVCLVDRPGSPQSTLLLGNLGITRLSPDFFPFLVANEVLGGGFNSRLVTDIRETKGLAYDIDSRNQAFRDLGAWVVSTQVRTEATGEALQATLDELAKLRAAAPSTAEMEQARNYLGGNFILGLETQAEVSDQFTRAAAYGVPDDYLADWVSKVQDVSPDAALHAAVAHIHPDAELIVVVGDAKTLLPQLEKFAPDGKVEMYDEKGEPVAKPAAGGQR